MESRLLLVTQSGNVDDLYSLIGADPNVLHNVDILPFIHTPLHEASSAGKMDLAMELMMLKPSLAKKLNEDGLSPLHLAVENQYEELALELVKVDPSLVRICGRGGMTPLHLVTEKGDFGLLTEFLLACPESIKDANLKGETALHITVMNDSYEGLKVLTGWMQKIRDKDGVWFRDVLNRCNREGNTALHLAAYKNNHEAVKQLLKCLHLNRNIQNKTRMTALDALRANGSHMNKDTEEIIVWSGGKTGGSQSQRTEWYVFLRNPVTFKEFCKSRLAHYRSHMSDGTRNALLVIVALIIAATYQTAAQPQEKPKKTAQPDNNEEYIFEPIIWGCNTVAFYTAILFTLILLPEGKLFEGWYGVITGPLALSYFLFMHMKEKITVMIYLAVLYGFACLVYLLVLCTVWRLKKPQNVVKAKTELVYENFRI
ncbi:hypothetical protein CARUB_v10026457mg [Capsella rubella]|uniref:Uncharacterized protein n=1 Tax=Capsella rubella TaxID=81985 RepID=R0G9Z7_9BRAS|nr:hypothetical protein CARUB_v10026457mg [Capsella rubella]